MLSKLRKLGPGLLFAGAAIGVSHLVQSTRAGADFGFGLLWALLLVNLFKYPFFQFGPRYAMATGDSLVKGYGKLGRPILIVFFLLTLASMFTIQTAVTIVTASLASNLFGAFDPITVGSISLNSIQIWTVVLLAICASILWVGRYKLLDRLMKVIIITLTISTIFALVASISNIENPISMQQVFPKEASWAFLIAFMGWMPAPLDISVWHSLWSLEKHKGPQKFEKKNALFDFNIGYIATIILGIGFLSLGALIMFHSKQSLSTNASEFAGQLINIYTSSLGSWSYLIIGIAAFTTMFSTTLTTLDGSPRVMDSTTSLLLNKQIKSYRPWLFTLIIGCITIFFAFSSELGQLVKIATILSFLTAPFYAILNYKLMCSKSIPKDWKLSKLMHVLSWAGILFLIGFSLWYLSIL